MGDLITRRAAYETLTEYYHHTHMSQHIALKDALDKVPSAETQRKGKWIVLPPTDPWIYACDQCGKLSDDDANYCPDCGAEMKGVKYGKIRLC